MNRRGFLQRLVGAVGLAVASKKIPLPTEELSGSGTIYQSINPNWTWKQVPGAMTISHDFYGPQNTPKIVELLAAKTKALEKQMMTEFNRWAYKPNYLTLSNNLNYEQAIIPQGFNSYRDRYGFGPHRPGGRSTARRERVLRRPSRYDSKELSQNLS